MTQSELLAWANGVFKHPEYRTMSDNDRIHYTIDALTAKFGETIYRTVNNRGVNLYIVNVTPASARTSDNNTDNNASTTATGLTVSTATTDNTADVTTTAALVAA
jgi:hypothetical protein